MRITEIIIDVSPCCSQPGECAIADCEHKGLQIVRRAYGDLRMVCADSDAFQCATCLPMTDLTLLS